MANLKDLLVNGVTRFIGKVYAPTPETGDNSAQVATTAFVMENVEQISEALNNKMDRSGGNATNPLDSSFLDLIGGSVGGSVPDINWSGAISIARPATTDEFAYTAPSDGLFSNSAGLIATTSTVITLTINGVNVALASNVYPLKKGDVFKTKWSAIDTTYSKAGTSYFYPYKT